MQQVIAHPGTDPALLAKFQAQIGRKIPHLDESSSLVVNSTPLVDITSVLLECARVDYDLDLSRTGAKVYGKFDSLIFGGSIKVRPAVAIVEIAIASGHLRSGQTIFEATSGNFGLALGMLRGLGLDVVALVSRRLQDGVVDELRKDGVKLIDLDVDVCPAPGLAMDVNTILANTIAASVRERLVSFGFSGAVFDHSRNEIVELLARQDVIGLAKLLAKVYDGFCPEQYDNEWNVKSHESVTGPEIDQQLKSFGERLPEFRVISTFGTGGTSTGLSRYIQGEYGRKSVHLIFPLSSQDVGGIRTREKAAGLRFYVPELYAGEHEVDFEAARPILRFFVRRGYNIGESSALALYACMQMLQYGVGTKFVVILADGIQKYSSSLEAGVESPRRLEVTLQEARSTITDYGEVLWTHTTFVPSDDGMRRIASSLGCGQDMIRVAKARDVQSLVSGHGVPVSLKGSLANDRRAVLLVCMAGETSLKVAEILAKTGVKAHSLAGGITDPSMSSGRRVPELVRLATE